MCSYFSSNRPLFAALQAREYLSKLGDLSQTQIFAKIENVEVCFNLPCSRLFLFVQVFTYSLIVLWEADIYIYHLIGFNTF